MPPPHPPPQPPPTAARTAVRERGGAAVDAAQSLPPPPHPPPLPPQRQAQQGERGERRTTAGSCEYTPATPSTSPHSDRRIWGDKGQRLMMQAPTATLIPLLSPPQQQARDGGRG
ncbi:unnamed protein product [Closterium sp. NIES-54]